jgi:hypothetical protein
MIAAPARGTVITARIVYGMAGQRTRSPFFAIRRESA